MVGDPIELQLSEKTTVTVGVLDGLEEDVASLIYMGMLNRMSGSDKLNALALLEGMSLRARIFGVCSIRSINGDNTYHPLINEKEYARTTNALSREERNALRDWANVTYGEPISEADLKNALSDQDSPPQ
jgi:hypothetical protein